MSDIIKEGDHVVLMKTFDAENTKIIPVTKEGTLVYYGKLRFDPSPVIGSQFGSVFLIKDGTMTRIDDFEKFNSELTETVASNLITYRDKSTFSQEKIIQKKKRQSHSNVVTAIKPTLLHINEMLYSRDKIGGMRIDMLAQILTLSNVQSGSKCLVLDHNLGIMTAAVMSRILPLGTCIQLIPDLEYIQTTRRTLSMLNIGPEESRDSLLSISIRDLYKVKLRVDNFETENDILKARRVEHVERLSRERNATSKGESDVESMDLDSDNKIPNSESLQSSLIKKDAQRELRNQERISATRILKSERLDSMIFFVQNTDPLPLLRLTLEFLPTSKQFVIYSDTIEPLIECHQFLKSSSMAVSLNISESWLRKYQVLPDRTRPEMNMSGYGGYLLSGTKAQYGLLDSDKGDQDE